MINLAKLILIPTIILTVSKTCDNNKDIKDRKDDKVAIVTEEQTGGFSFEDSDRIKKLKKEIGPIIRIMPFECEKHDGANSYYMGRIDEMENSTIRTRRDAETISSAFNIQIDNQICQGYDKLIQNWAKIMLIRDREKFEACLMDIFNEKSPETTEFRIQEAHIAMKREIENTLYFINRLPDNRGQPTKQKCDPEVIDPEVQLADDIFLELEEEIENVDEEESPDSDLLFDLFGVSREKTEKKKKTEK